jgi:hypothetical protein
MLCLHIHQFDKYCLKLNITSEMELTGKAERFA